MRRGIRHDGAPLTTDTGRPIELPPVRTRLATKFNLLSIGLIVLTAVAVTALVFYRQWTDAERELRVQGETLAQMLADLSAPGLQEHNTVGLAHILESLPEEANFAYVYVLDAERRVVAVRYLAPALRDGVIPALTAGELPPYRGPTRVADRVLPQGRLLEFVTPVMAPGTRAETPASNANNARTAGLANRAALLQGPLGYIRLGMSFETQRAVLLDQMLGALAVAAVLIVMAVAVTVILTRRLVAPMHRLMRAARAVGAGGSTCACPHAHPTSSAS